MRVSRGDKVVGTCRRKSPDMFMSRDPLMITTTIPLKIVSVANLGLNRFAHARLSKAHRTRARSALAAVAMPPGLPLTVVLTRIAPRDLDTDNLASAFKATRDGVADWLGVDDGSKDLDWQYAQRRGGAGEYMVEIEVI